MPVQGNRPQFCRINPGDRGKVVNGFFIAVGWLWTSSGQAYREDTAEEGAGNDHGR